MKTAIQRTIMIVLLLAIFACYVLASDGAQIEQPGTVNAVEWTILIFVNADNNLEPDGVMNYRQLAKVGSSDRVNVIVQFDRINKYYNGPGDHTNPDWAQTLRFKVTKGVEPIPANALEDIGEADMGSGKTLGEFVL
jgi:hypothetical protein